MNEESIGHYTIREKIGAGGMGEVYRATDTKLGRDVAVKALPVALVPDPERLARFQREAQLLASLNHPNIGAIYGVEERGQARFLILELVPGPTLADRLAAGAIPVPESLRIAKDIAEAVEYAHESGIVHRDLKPANVKVTDDDRVKVLDFGLAKAFEDPASSASRSIDPVASPTISPTLASPVTGALTGVNVILGTAAYMSPEQARGHAVDKRADVWAFGVILFEMLTGRRLFDGETVSDTLAAVLRKEPEWDTLPADTPAPIRRLLRRCLRRKPRERIRDIGDARLVIEDVLSGRADEEGEAGGARSAAPSRPSRPWLLPAVAIAAAALAFAAARLDAPRPAAEPLRKYAMPLPSGTRVNGTVLAPDGSAVAYVANNTLTVQELTTLEKRELDASAGIRSPSWSPDGDWIAYGSGTGLWKVRRSGGSPMRVATAPDGAEFDTVGRICWRKDGTILFTTGDTALHSVSGQGGTPVDFVPLAEDDADFHELADLDGRAVAFIPHDKDGRYGTIDVVRADGKRLRVAEFADERLHDLEWSPTGHLLFGRRGDADGIWALPLDRDRFEPAGSAFPVAPGGRDPGVIADGTLVYSVGATTRLTTIGLVDREGRVRETFGDPADFYMFPSVSPDGRQIATRLDEGGTRNLWLIDVARGARRRFTQGEGVHTWGTWDPTGRTFWYFDDAFSADAGSFRMPANGTGRPELVVHGHVPNVSHDGRWLLYMRPPAPEDSAGTMDLWIKDLARADDEGRPLVAEPGRQWVCRASPTDNLLSYASNATGRWEVQLTDFPERHGSWPVSTTGGWWSEWRSDGRELYYAVGDSIMVVRVDPGEGASDPVLSRPELLFRRPRYDARFPSLSDGFAVMPGGESFVLNLAPEDESVAPSIVITRNWFAEFAAAE